MELVEADTVYVAGQSAYPALSPMKPVRMEGSAAETQRIEQDSEGRSVYAPAGFFSSLCASAIRCSFIWLLAALALGFGLRLYGLARESLWLDEATSILLAQSDIPTLIRATAQDIHPPVYYLFLHFWVKLGVSEFAVRALSVCLGTLSIAVIFALGRSLFDEWVGVGSALLLAVSPLHVWYSQETRMYVLVTLWTLAGSFWLWRALQAGGKRRWLAYVLCMALGLYTHYHTVFILLFQNAFVALVWIGRRDRHLLRVWVMAQAGILLLFLPWLPVLLNQIAQGGGGWVEKAIGNPAPRALIETWIDFSLGTVRQWYPLWLRRAGYILLALALLMPLWQMWRRRGRYENGHAWLYLWLYWALSLGAAWLVSQVKPMYAGRYLLPFLPPYLVLLAAGATRRQTHGNDSSRSLTAKRPKSLLRVVFILALSALCLVGVALTVYYPQKDDWRGTVQYVLQAARRTRRRISSSLCRSGTTSHSITMRADRSLSLASCLCRYQRMPT